MTIIPRKLRAKFSRLNYYFAKTVTIYAPSFFASAAGFYFVTSSLCNLEKDSTSFTNFGFGICASLAALSFTLSQAIQVSKDKKPADDALFAGERFLHSSILLLVASIIKYTYLSVAVVPFLINHPNFLLAVKFPVNLLASLLFLSAVLSAHTGLIVINKLLWKRIARHPDWDSF